ncbi:hypothetical protein QWZ16_19885 [Vibrio ostreicida]|uniref:Uncharacterized protein n=1 Tax=Vibrio ostreicida TaxID=526588 RepID=A0ABT8BYU2_9VIBR|nr:hypothetical protein [Vibrio ostreicida]MDN3611859.1 hypothetical protein [Vibrio ostreicida]
MVRVQSAVTDVGAWQTFSMKTSCRSVFLSIPINIQTQSQLGYCRETMAGHASRTVQALSKPPPLNNSALSSH